MKHVDVTESDEYDLTLQRARPEASKVSAIPKSNPKLRHYVDDIFWNCIEHTVRLHLGEASNFGVYNWISNINEIRTARLKSAFGDKEQEVLNLEFKSIDNDLIATLVLTGLELVDHECAGGKDHYGYLKHNVVIKYDKIEIQTPGKAKENK
jgi:hypothetical protein